MKKIFILLLSVFLLTGCTLFKSDVMEDINVYTTTYPTSYLINYLYQDHAKVESIYPTGINFKEYELSDKKLTEYAKSDLFIFNSQDNDKDYAALMNNKNKNLKLIDATLGMEYTYSLEELWLNPYNYLMMAKNIKNSLSEYITNPYLVEEINNNYETLQYELSKLDATYQDDLKDSTTKIIVTDNSLFKFLEKYNIEVISLEEEIKDITITEGDTLSDISKEYNISVSDILTYNNKTSESVNPGDKLKLPIKLIESTDLLRVKKLISEGEIKYIYTTSESTNNVVSSLIKDESLEQIVINTMYSVDGGINSTNDNYLTVMFNNLELFKKELYK